MAVTGSLAAAALLGRGGMFVVRWWDHCAVRVAGVTRTTSDGERPIGGAELFIAALLEMEFGDLFQLYFRVLRHIDPRCY